MIYKQYANDSLYSICTRIQDEMLWESDFEIKQFEFNGFVYGDD